MWEDKRFRQLVIAVLLVVLALGLMSLVSTALQLIVPLALILGGGFAFYKIVLEGRDQPQAMADEIAEASGAVNMRADDDLADDDTSDNEIDEDEDEEARQRLSAIERARSDFLEVSTPAQEVLDHMRARRNRLEGDEE